MLRGSDDIIEYIKNPMTEKQLQLLLDKLNKKPQEIIRTQEEVYIKQFKGKNFNDEEWPMNYIGLRQQWGGMEPFGLLDPDRRQHAYCIGKSGTGKTTLLRNLILQDIELGKGVGVIEDVAQAGKGARRARYRRIRTEQRSQNTVRVNVVTQRRRSQLARPRWCQIVFFP